MNELMSIINNSNSVFYVSSIYTLLFYVGVFGLILNRKNYLITIMCIEIIYLSLSLLFIRFSLYLADPTGQIFVVFILTISAIESAISLALLISYFKSKGYIVFQKINKKI